MLYRTTDQRKERKTDSGKAAAVTEGKVAFFGSNI